MKPIRIRSIDTLRGIVMVLMALDHVRDYFTDVRFSPTDLEHSNPALFFTRWITHYCAPVFVFLSGTSAFLSMRKGKTKAEAARFLLSRGLWLIFLELTVVRLGWQFNVDYHFSVLQVIWVLGASMMAMSALIFLPRSIMMTLALLLIFGHNLLDAPAARAMLDHPAGYLLHLTGPVFRDDQHLLLVMYPLIPWVGVMMAGYSLGPLFLQEPERRNKQLQLIGLGAIALFFVLRGINVYGDPHPWQQQGSTVMTVLSFFNVEKYPPSLLYLLMTLGPAIALMPLLEKWKGWLPERIAVYGKVPMFYYLLHIYVIHGLSMLTGIAMGFPPSLFTDMGRLFNSPSGWGFGLAAVYGWWLLIVVLLYFPSRWFMHIKMKHRKWWLSYL